MPRVVARLSCYTSPPTAAPLPAGVGAQNALLLFYFPDSSESNQHSYGTVLRVLQTHPRYAPWSDSGKYGISSKSKQAAFWRRKEKSGGGSGRIAAPVKWG